MLLNSSDKIPSRHLRNLNADLPRSNKKYISKLNQKQRKNNFFLKRKSIKKTNEANYAKAEFIDTQLIKLSKFTKILLPSPSSTHWSEEVHTNNITTKIVSYRITQIKKGIDMAKSIKNLQQRLKFGNEVTASLEES